MNRWGKAGLAVLPGLLFLGIWFWAGKPPETKQIPAGTEDERLAFLASCGITGQLLSEQHITVPGEDAIFADYIALQRLQQLPLAAHTGEAGTVYTYIIDSSSLRAELLCTDTLLIGAQLYLPEEGQGMPLLHF